MLVVPLAGACKMPNPWFGYADESGGAGGGSADTGAGSSDEGAPSTGSMSDPAGTVDPPDTDQTGDSGDSGDSGDGKDTGDTGDIGEPGDTNDTGEPGDTSESGTTDDDPGDVCAWQFRQRLDVLDAVPGAELVRVPVVVKLEPDRFDYGAAQADGADLRFANADGSASLAYEIESWQTDGTSIIWLNLPSLGTTTGEHLWMYSGNASATDRQDPSGVWDPSYVAVWHMDVALADSTSNGHHGTLFGPTQAAGRLADGLAFDAIDDYGMLSVGSVDNFTLEVWAHPTAPDHYGTIVGNNNQQDIQIWGEEAGESAWNLTYYSDGNHYANSPVLPETWTFVAVSRNAGSVRYFHNGVPDGEALISPALVVDTVGGNDKSDEYFGGTFDEMRISSAARSPEWIAIQYASMTDALLSYGPAAQATDPCSVLVE